MNRIWLAPLVLITLVGCKHTSAAKLKSAPAAELQPGWVNHQTKFGFSIAGPSNWRLTMPTIMSLNLGNPDQSAPPPPDTLDPDVAAKQEADGILLKLYDNNVKPTPGEEMTQFFVKKESSPGSLDDAAKDLKGDMPKAEMTTVDLPIGKAAVFKSTTTTVGGDSVLEILYLVVNGDDEYRFRWDATGNAGSIDQDSAAMMQTLRFS